MFLSLRLGITFSLRAGAAGATVLTKEVGMLADLLGVEPGDVLLAANGTAFKTVWDVQNFAAWDGSLCEVSWFDLSAGADREDVVLVRRDARTGGWRCQRVTQN